jgi:hypothetical protein
MANTNYAFPFPQAWDAQDLADAVPLRLSELPPFDAATDGVTGCANGRGRIAHRARRHGYLRVPEPARFHVG